MKFPTRNGVEVRGPLKPLPALDEDTKAFICSKTAKGWLLLKEEPRFCSWAESYKPGQLMLVHPQALTSFHRDDSHYINLLDPASNVDVSHLSEEYRLHCASQYDLYYGGRDYVPLPVI